MIGGSFDILKTRILIGQNAIAVSKFNGSVSPVYHGVRGFGIPPPHNSHPRRWVSSPSDALTIAYYNLMLPSRHKLFHQSGLGKRRLPSSGWFLPIAMHAHQLKCIEDYYWMSYHTTDYTYSTNLRFQDNLQNDSRKEIVTPNIDALVANGLELNRHYVR